MFQPTTPYLIQLRTPNLVPSGQAQRVGFTGRRSRGRVRLFGQGLVLLDDRIPDRWMLGVGSVVGGVPSIREFRQMCSYTLDWRIQRISVETRTEGIKIK